MNQMKNEDLMELNQEMKLLKTEIENNDVATEVLEIEEDDNDDDIIINIIEQVEDIDDDYNDDDDDDEEDDDDDLHITNKDLRKERKERKKELRKQKNADIKQLKKDLGKGPAFREARKKVRKTFRRVIKGDRKTVRLQLRANRQNRRAKRKEERKLHQGQRSGILGIFRKVLAAAKNTLINIAINGLNSLSEGLKADHFAKPAIDKVVAFLDGLRSSGLSTENPLGIKMSETSEKVDQFVSKVKDAVNHIKIKAKATLKEIFDIALQYLKDSKSPILQIVSMILGVFMI